ncbi:MAG TPA: glutaredoxin 3 [Acidiferrobacterales bacterium]|nr:glutaredoxin 3 [Acidiferrobacterales bacterium]
MSRFDGLTAGVARILMYSTRVCPYCIRAEQLLAKKGIAPDQIEKIRVDEHPEQRAEMLRITGRRSVPQIFIGDRHVGGFDDLAALDADGELEPLLRG